MGTRYYLHAWEKPFTKSVISCNSLQELYTFGKSVNKDVAYYDSENHYYLPIYNWGNIIFEFGSYFEYAKHLVETGVALFPELSPLHEYFAEHWLTMCNRELLRSIIEWQRERIVDNYKDLLSRTVDREKHLLAHVHDHLMWWEPEFGDYTAYNLSDKTDMLTDSWLYEHTIFDLVRIYKTFDFDKYDLIFLCW